jgi:PAS domain S-box-containing protein
MSNDSGGDTPFHEQILYERLFRRANDAIVLFNIDDKIIDVNESACRLFGYTREEFLDLTVSDLVPEESRIPGAERIKNELHTHGRRPFETVDIKKDGTRFFAEITNTEVSFAEERYVFSVVRDISARKQLEAELRISEALEKSIIESPASINIWAIDREYRYTFFNNAHREAMHLFWDMEIEIGSSVLNYIKDPEYRDNVKKQYDRLLTGEEFSAIDELAGPEGEKQYFENIGSPIRDNAGVITGATIFTTDITERVRLEQELRDSVALQQSIINSPPDVLIHSIDRNYRYLFFNNAHKRAMEEVWGIGPNLGDNVLELITDPVYREDVRKHFDRALKGDNFCEIDNFIDTKGETKYFECISAPIKDTLGRITGITIFNIDITDRILAEEKIKESLKEKEILLKEIHHRVKNNLQVIISMLNLQISAGGDDTVKTVLSESQNRITSMAMIHEQLYQSESLARINMRDYLSSLVSFVVDSFTTGPSAVSIDLAISEVDLDIDTAIPVGLIVNELVSNSMKYAFKEEEEGALRLILESKDGRYYHLTVEDNGVGLPSNLKRGREGKLGLQMVAALAEQLGGIFTVNNGAQNRGVKASVTFLSEKKQPG